MKPITLLCFLVFFLTLTACREEWVRTIEFDKKLFDSERAAWQKKKPPKYSFVFEAFQGMPKDTVELVVANDVLISAEYVDKRDYDVEIDTKVYRWKNIGTIDDIFMLVENDFSKYNNDDDIIHIKMIIDYDTVYHYPKEVYFSFGGKEREQPLGGGGYSLDISNFIDLSSGK